MTAAKEHTIPVTIDSAKSATVTEVAGALPLTPHTASGSAHGSAIPSTPRISAHTPRRPSESAALTLPDAPAGCNSGAAREPPVGLGISVMSSAFEIERSPTHGVNAAFALFAVARCRATGGCAHTHHRSGCRAVARTCDVGGAPGGRVGSLHPAGCTLYRVLVRRSGRPLVKRRFGSVEETSFTRTITARISGLFLALRMSPQLNDMVSCEHHRGKPTDVPRGRLSRGRSGGSCWTGQTPGRGASR